jgi:hypothetical protein
MSDRDREASRLPEMYPRCTRVFHGQATRNTYLQAFRASPLTRTVDPLLTMEVEAFGGGSEATRFPPCFSWISCALTIAFDLVVERPRATLSRPKHVPKTCPQDVVTAGVTNLCDEVRARQLWKVHAEGRGMRYSCGITSVRTSRADARRFTPLVVGNAPGYHPPGWSVQSAFDADAVQVVPIW